MTRLLFVVQDSWLLASLREALAALSNEVRGMLEARFFSPAEIDGGGSAEEGFFSALREADFLYMELHGGTPYFKSFPRVEAELARLPFFFHSGLDDENEIFEKKSSLPRATWQKLLAYHMAGGAENCRSLLLCLAAEVGCRDLDYDAPVFSPTEGLLFLPQGMTEEEYLDEAARGTKAVIGVIVHRYSARSGDTAHILALVEAIRDQGALPVAVYTNVAAGANGGGLREALAKYFSRGGRTIVDAVIVACGFALSLTSAPGEGVASDIRSVFEPLDVPVLQALATPYPLDEWRRSLNGMSPSYLCTGVFQPEFDGQLISLPLACTEREMGDTGALDRYRPIPGMAERLARVALNWARLRAIPNGDKKIAIIFHNMPPRIDMIGCAYGLDSHASAAALCEGLTRRGYALSRPFASGREIIDEITAGLTNDGRFLPPEEMLARAAALMDSKEYEKIFDSLPEKNKKELLSDWGTPPGEFMTAKGKIFVPGIINGNIFIGLQPPRALEEKAEEAYHSTDIVCPHQYLAFYRWLRDIFRADAVIHVGTHGTIEWLPGKETALSEECWPVIAISELPNFYPYIIDVPGEGMQAKRRISAAVIDHLIPAMDEAGLYGGLEEAESLIEHYCHARIADRRKVPSLAKKIAETAAKEKLFEAAGLTEEKFFDDCDGGVEKLHMLLSEIKMTKIKDGLHVMGRPPRGAKLAELLRLLLAVPNGEIPSLRDGAAHALGFELEALLAEPARADERGTTNLMKLAEIDKKLAELFTRWQETGFAEAAAAPLAERHFGQGRAAGRLIKTMRYAAREILPRVERTDEELENLLRGLEGRFVPPGPSGSPSRGGAELLPTGRNFYSIDPTGVPSRAAWTTGVSLAKGLLEKYKKEKGGVPESAAIVVYAGDTMKTRGDDIAEIMYLYGVRPLWLENSERVTGIEPIPLAELGRPRVDVTLRISGLFRDAFPNLIERIEDAVNLVASLDEPPERNFIKKHVGEDIAAFMQKGISAAEADEAARVRVFGCPPGGYGCGVDIMVNSKKWQNADDLGRAYTTWSAHGYTKKLHGRKMEAAFTARLSKCAVTVKNIASYEQDMLDDDDYYGYHGGLISAVGAASGSLPLSLSASSADPAHVSTKDIREEAEKIVLARICNPKWIEGLKEHGFRGAQEFSAALDIVFGWDATASVIEDRLYDRIADTYLMDEELRRWIEENNKWALHAMAERLLEAEARGMWSGAEGRLEAVRAIFLETDGDLEGI